jgi:hypothetical protein
MLFGSYPLVSEKGSSSDSQKPRSLLRLLAWALSSFLFGSSSHVSDLPHGSNNADNPNNSTNEETERCEIFTTSPLRVAIDSVPRPQPPTDEQKAEKKTKQKYRKLKTILEIAALLIALGLLGANLLLWRSTRDANQIAKDSLEISQRPYITIGRKDGILAEIIDAKGKDEWANLVIHFQNSGHLPAKVCILVDGSAWPLMPYNFQNGTTMIRQKGKDSNGLTQVTESSCPTIGGESVSDFVIEKRFNQKVWDQLRNDKNSDIRITAYIQYCDPFGRYMCKRASLKYLTGVGRFGQLDEEDCSQWYGLAPQIPTAAYGTNELLPPCARPKENEEYQKAYIRGVLELQRKKKP